MTFPTFFLIAGEASGDVLGAHLMRAVNAKLNGQVRFVGVGGPMMQAEGLELFFPHTELMHFGVIEVLRHIPRLLRRIRETAHEVVRLAPDALITIDAPDFNFRVAKRVRAAAPGIKLIHYVAPTVWAWRPGRARKIAQFLDHLLAVLPFEPPYFSLEGLNCTFVGHPLIETQAGYGYADAFFEAHGLSYDAKVLAVLPGSRSGEVSRLMPIYREVVARLKIRHPDLQIALPAVPHLRDRIVAEAETWDLPVHIVDGEQEKYDAFAAATAALACSGTVALELALARLPAAIAYRVHPLTAFLYRSFIHTPYANLVNIMHGKEVVPEFIQEKCTVENLTDAIDALLSDRGKRHEQITEISVAAAWLGRGQFLPSDRAAKTVLGAIQKRRKPVAVLQVVPSMVTGGVERGTVETVAALAAAGFRPVVASAGGPMVKEIEAAGGVHVTLPLKTKNPFSIYLNTGRLTEVIRAHKVDIVHARSRAPAWSAYFAARRTGAPFITTFHNAYGGAENRLKRWYNSSMAKGNRIIAISYFVGIYAKHRYGIPADILRIIPRGVDIGVFDRANVPFDRIESLRRAWNVPRGAPLILMPGRITRWKGQSVLIEALSELARRDFICVIVGGGKDSRYGQELVEDIQLLGMSSCITIVDTCRDMPAAYCLADIVVVPSTRPEGFGRVVIEAQAMGVPVIASNHGGACETVIDGQTGFLTTPGDPHALASDIETILSMSRQDRDALAAHAVAHVRAHFTTASMTGKTLDVYRELLTTRKG